MKKISALPAIDVEISASADSEAENDSDNESESKVCWMLFMSHERLNGLAMLSIEK